MCGTVNESHTFTPNHSEQKWKLLRMAGDNASLHSLNSEMLLSKAKAKCYTI